MKRRLLAVGTLLVLLVPEQGRAQTAGFLGLGVLGVQGMEGALGGTFGGNPVCCEAALATLDLFETGHLCSRGRDSGSDCAGKGS